MITSDSLVDNKPVSGLFEMSSTMHNGHSTWESTSNALVLFKGTSGAWQVDQTTESESEDDENGDCPSSAQLMLFSVQIASQDGLFRSTGYFP